MEIYLFNYFYLFQFFLRYPFYVFTCHLILGSLGILLGQFVVTIPLSLSGRPLYGNGALMITLTINIISVVIHSFSSLFCFSFLISANRFCFLFSSRLHRILFENYRLHITWLVLRLRIIAKYIVFYICYLYNLQFRVVNLLQIVFKSSQSDSLDTWINTTLIGCPKVFRHDMFYYTYRCPERSTSVYQDIFMSITSHLGYIGGLSPNIYSQPVHFTSAELGDKQLLVKLII
uniref:Cytochrome c oxidase subunit 1 n=1 Tax=Heterorhabditis bacteriophora TaxID=37862 RepID=A0A1I7W6Y0_HETBA